MKSKLLGVALSVALALGLVTQGQADPITVSLSDSITTATCADGAACDASGLAGVIAFTSTLGTLTVSIGGTGSGSPALAPFEMDLSYNITTNSSAPAKTYIVQVSENDQSGSVGGWNATVGGTQNNGATTAFSAFADAGNALFGTATPLCSAGPSSALPVGLSCSSGPFSDPSFSLTERVTIAAQAGSTSASGDALLQVRAVPEPSAAVLLGAALLLWVGITARIQQKTTSRRS